MTNNFYSQFAQILKQTPVVLATVTQVKGSVPREVGAKMLIWGESSTFGTIGGGAGEAKVIQQALQTLKTGEKQFVEIDLSGTSPQETQGVCGGWMQVWLERWMGENAIALLHAILNSLESSNPIALVTPLTSDSSPILQPLTPSHSSIPQLIPFQDNLVFFEPLTPSPTLLILGAGHVGIALAKLAQFIGFQIAVQDDRLEFTTPERFPAGTQILPLSFADALKDFPTLSNLYIALVTRGYQYDLEALNLLLRLPQKPYYLGMIGSRRRVKTVFDNLEEKGIPPQLFQQIHAPIGLDIGALTPEEIAVSICAELIQIRRQNRT